MNKLLIVGAWAASWLVLAPAMAAPVLFLSPAQQAVAVGGSVSVDVKISGLLSGGVSEIVSVFDINVLYNSGLLSESSNVFAAAGQLGGLLSHYDTIGSVIGQSAGFGYSDINNDASLALLQSDTFTLFTLTFTGLTDGAAFLDFGPSLDFDRGVTGRNASALNLTYANACVAIGTGQCSELPEPATLGLVGMALLGACAPAYWRRRKSTAV